MIELEWIPVGARLPDDETQVLVARDDGEVGAGFLSAEVWFWVDAMPIDSGFVTHWMPLPAAPGARPMMRLGQICARLGFEVTEDFLFRLGFAPAARDRAARLYAESDYP